MPEGDNEKFTIRLNLRSESIPVNIFREEEALYRMAANLINERYNVYAEKYTGHMSDRRIAMMTLLDIALSYQRELTKNDTGPYDSTLARLTSEIENALK